MTDDQLIDMAYEDTVKNLFTVLFQAYVIASPTSRKDADSRFQEGVKLAREAREQAKKLV